MAAQQQRQRAEVLENFTGSDYSPGRNDKIYFFCGPFQVRKEPQNKQILGLSPGLCTGEAIFDHAKAELKNVPVNALSPFITLIIQNADA